MNKKILAISDIHGCLYEFKKLLQKVGYSPIKHQLILVGDYCDRGPQSKEVIEFVKKLQEQDDAKILCGNHDRMFLDFIDYFDTLFLNNGGLMTLQSYLAGTGISINALEEARKFIIEEYADHIEFLRNLPFYYETNTHLFVHAGVDPYFGKEWKEKMVEEDMLWIRNDFIYRDVDIEKTIVFGHTPVINIHNDPNVWFNKNKIGIDGGCVFGYQLNALEIIENNQEIRYETYSYPEKLTPQ